MAMESSPFPSLPEDCEGDVLDYLDVKISHVKAMQAVQHSPEARKYVHALIYAFVDVIISIWLTS